MPRWFLIIDGYNLMHAWGLARRRYGPGEFQRLRERFLRQLANRLTEEQRARTTVVFDAGDEAPTDVSSKVHFESMRIVYAIRDPDADARIEKLVAEHSAPRQIRVVSSDRRLQTAARRRRGQFVTSEQFLAELDQEIPSASPSPLSPDLNTKYTGEMTEAEMAEWLEIFGESDDG
jgi:predicted RNA-binding protein with PIN domain